MDASEPLRGGGSVTIWETLASWHMCCPRAGVSVPGPFLSLLPGVVLALERCWKPAGVTVSQEAEAAAHCLLGGQLHGLAPHNPATNWGRVPSLPASVCHSFCVPSTAQGGLCHDFLPL